MAKRKCCWVSERVDESTCHNEKQERRWFYDGPTSWKRQLSFVDSYVNRWRSLHSIPKDRQKKQTCRSDSGLLWLVGSTGTIAQTSHWWWEGEGKPLWNFIFGRHSAENWPETREGMGKQESYWWRKIHISLERLDQKGYQEDYK